MFHIFFIVPIKKFENKFSVAKATLQLLMFFQNKIILPIYHIARKVRNQILWLKEVGHFLIRQDPRLQGRAPGFRGGEVKDKTGTR